MLPLLGPASEALRNSGAYLYATVDPSRIDPLGFGEPRAFPRVPRALLIACSPDDEADVQAWANSLWDDTFKPRHIQVGVRTDGSFPFLGGIPTGDITTVIRSDTFWSPDRSTFAIPAEEIFAGRVMCATITKYRVTWRPDQGLGEPNNLGDYLVNRTNNPDPPPTGFTEYPDPSPPPGFPFAGFTVYAGKAAIELDSLHSVVSRFKLFKHIFYQSTEEAPATAGSGGADSTIVPDSAMDALMGGSPYLERKSYSPGDLSGVLDVIMADALAFLTAGV